MDSVNPTDVVGAITVVVSLSREQCGNRDPPAPLCMHLPRTTLLAAIQQSVRNVFTPHIPDSGRPLQTWCTLKGTPVPWHLPVGVLYDIEVAEGTTPAIGPLILTAEFDPDSSRVPDCCATAIMPLQPSQPAMTTTEMANFVREGVAKSLRFLVAHAWKASLSSMHGDTKLFYNAKEQTTGEFIAFALFTEPQKPETIRSFWSLLRQFRSSKDMPSTCVNIVLYCPRSWKIRPAMIAVKYREDLTLGQAIREALTARGLRAVDSRDLAQGSPLLVDSPKAIYYVLHGLTPPLETNVGTLFDYFATSDYRLHVVLAETDPNCGR